MLYHGVPRDEADELDLQHGDQIGGDGQRGGGPRGTTDRRLRSATARLRARLRARDVNALAATAWPG